MIKITTRNTSRGREFIFRHNDKLYVFTSKNDAKIKLQELQGTLF